MLQKMMMKSIIWILVGVVVWGGLAGVAIALENGEQEQGAPLATPAGEEQANETQINGTQMKGDQEAEQEDWMFSLALAEDKQVYTTIILNEQEDILTQSLCFVEGENKVELLRLYYGETEEGENIGALSHEGAKVPVSYLIPEHTDKEISQVEDIDTYFSLMSDVGNLLNEIYNDERLVLSRSNNVTNSETIIGTIWNIQLLPNMWYKENRTDGRYQVNFYGSVANDQILLYTIYLGDDVRGNVLGTYQIDGKHEPVSVEIHEMKMKMEWSDEDIIAIGASMGTVNDVIQEIMASEQFTPQ